MLKNQKSALLFLFVLFSVWSEASAQTKEGYRYLSLQQAVDQALETNTNVLNAELDNEIAKKQISEFLSSGLPQLSATLDFNKNLTLRKQFIPANSFDPTGDPDEVIALAFGVPNNSYGMLQFEQMLFDGSFFVGLEAARTFTELTRKQHVLSKIEVVEGVTKAYYTVLINYKMAELVERNFARLDTLLRDTKLMYDNGFAEKLDVDRIKVQYNNTKVEYDNMQNLLSFSEMLLNYHMGIELETTLMLTDDIENLGLEYELEKTNTFEASHRVEYTSLQTQQRLNEIDLKNIRSQYIPKLNFYANYGGSNGTLATGDMFNVGDWRSFSAIGINAKMTLFDGFKKRSVAQQRKFKAKQLEYDLSTLYGLIALEVTDSKNKYNKSIDNMMAQKENMDLALSVYNATDTKYKSGVGSNSEVLDADASLKQAQTNYFNALYSALLSKVELKKALGELYK